MAVMGMEIASLFARVGADVTDFKSGMKGVKDDLTAQEKGLQTFGNVGKAAFGLVAGAAVALGAGFTAVVGKSVLAAADMEQGIADIGAMMNLTAEDTAKLQEHIMDLGMSPDLKVSATEASGAVMALGTAGLTMTEIMGGASEATVLLANATGLKGNEGFASAASIATDVMAQFNIEAQDLDKAVSAIAGTTVASKFTIDDYRLAIAQAGGVAGSVGVDFEDFNAVIAATSPSFASGSDAGTSFKTFLQRLVPQTDKAKEALIQLGLSTGEDVVTAFFDASGAMRPMEEIAGNLQGAFAGLSESQKIEAASTIFGTDAMRTALALAEGGDEIIREMKTAIGNVDAEELAKKRMDTLAGSWDIFLGVVETLTLGIGQQFIPIVRLTVDWLTSLAQQYGPPVIEMLKVFAGQVEIVRNWFAEVIKTGTVFNDKFKEMPAPIQAVVTAVINVIDAIRTVITVIGGFVTAIINIISPITDLIAEHVSWTDVIIGTAVAITAMLAPAIISAMAAGVAAAGAFIVAMAPVVIPIMAAIAAVAALRIAWEKDLGGIREITAFVWGVIVEVFGNVTSSLGDLVENFKKEWGVLADTNATLGERLALIWDTIKKAAIILFAGLVDAVRQMLPPFVAAVTQWGQAAQQWIIDATAPTRQKLQEYLDGIVEWGRSILTTVQNKFTEIKNSIIERVAAFIEGARSRIEEWRGWLAQKYEDIRNNIAQRMESIKNAVSEPVRNFIQETQDRIQGWHNFFVDVVERIRSGASERFGQLQSGISGFLQSVGSSWNIGWTGMAHATAKTTDDVTNDVSRGSGLWKGTWEATLSYLDYWTSHGWKYAYYYPIVAWINETARDIKSRWDETVDNLKAIWTTIVDTAKDKWNVFKVNITHIVMTLINDTKKDIDDWLTVLKSQISIKLGFVIKEFEEWRGWIVDIFEKAWENIQKAFHTVQEWAAWGRDIVQGLWDGLKQTWNNLSSWFTGVWSDLVDRFKDFFGIHSPSTLFTGFGRDMTMGLQIGVQDGSSGVQAAFTSLGSSINNSMTNIVGTVGNQLNSTIQSVIEGVRYGANMVNLATADVLRQSEEAERQARAKWEKLRDEMAKPLPPVTAPPVIPPSDVNNPNPPSIPPIILPPVIVPPPPPPPQPFNQKNLTDALKDVLGTQDITMPFLNLRDFADLMASTVDNAILSGKIAPSQLTAEQDIARVRAADAQDYQIAKVLDALQVLINLITTKGLGSNLNFDITSAPGDIADNRTELSVLIEYLTAIYAT